jgi:hypothetical protein
VRLIEPNNFKGSIRNGHAIELTGSARYSDMPQIVTPREQRYHLRSSRLYSVECIGKLLRCCCNLPPVATTVLGRGQRRADLDMVQGRFVNVRQFAQLAEYSRAGPAHVVPILARCAAF